MKKKIIALLKSYGFRQDKNVVNTSYWKDVNDYYTLTVAFEHRAEYFVEVCKDETYVTLFDAKGDLERLENFLQVMFPKT